MTITFPQAAEALAAVFVYLDDLRESGETNMFGAVPYILREFPCTRKYAEEALTAWMRAPLEQPPGERAIAHLSKAKGQIP